MAGWNRLASVCWQRVPTLPIRSVLTIELGGIDHRRIEQESFGSEAIEGGRLNPTIAVSSEKTAVQPIDHQHDDVSGRTTIHWHILSIAINLRRPVASFADSRKRIACQNGVAAHPIGIPGMAEIVDKESKEKTKISVERPLDSD